MSIKVKNVKAADPRISFDLEKPANEPNLNTLRVYIELSYSPISPDPNVPPTDPKYTSSVEILNLIDDTTLQFTVPFGDSSYAPGQTLYYRISLYSPVGTVSLYQSPPFTGQVITEAALAYNN